MNNIIANMRKKVNERNMKRYSICMSVVITKWRCNLNKYTFVDFLYKKPETRDSFINVISI